jgi:hypothetical protein
MTLKEKIVQILSERATELHDGAERLNVVDSGDFETIANDVEELLASDYGFTAGED